MQAYFASMHALGVRVSGLLSAGLGLEPSFFEGCTSEMAHALRLLHYSAEVRRAASGVGLFPFGSTLVYGKARFVSRQRSIWADGV